MPEITETVRTAMSRDALRREVGACGGLGVDAAVGKDTPMGRPKQPAELAPFYSRSTGQAFAAVGGHGGP